MPRMRHFSQIEETSYLCYHARPRVGRYIWRGRRPALFVPTDLTSSFVYPSFRSRDTPKDTPALVVSVPL
jgi:hypothetical protein